MRRNFSFTRPRTEEIKKQQWKRWKSASCRFLPVKVLKLSVKESRKKAEVISPLDGNQQVCKMLSERYHTVILLGTLVIL
jgi:hypothetical protein